MRDLRFVLFSAMLCIGALAGCTSDPAGTCSASSDCDRGLSCQQDGECGVAECGSASDCLSVGDFQETCLTEDRNGAYDANADGVCTNEECRTDRDCGAGESCISGACYAGGSVVTDDCTCSDDCAAGEACVSGACTLPPRICADSCECPAGQSCNGGICQDGPDPCEGVTCDAGETCDNGTCVGSTTCDPPCGTGETCNAGVCEPAVIEDGALCSSCAADADCGGEMDACVVLGDGTSFCGQSCSDANPCPGGFTCLAGNSRTGNQCYPAGGVCGGCLIDGCATGQYCNPLTAACDAVVATCESCAGDVQCGEGSLCATSGGSDICLTECATTADCAEGYSCALLGTKNVCNPTGADACGGSSGCDLLPTDCSAPLGIVDSNRCICVGCLSPSDCNDGQTCTTAGTCVADGQSCETTAECGAGYCQGGICIDCLTPGDCVDGEACVGGICQDCGCASNERCTATGECEEVGDPSDCSSDAECVTIARTLGFTGENAACDSVIGCYTVGTCNGSLIPGFEGEFGGQVDPFDAPCMAGTACTGSFDIFGMMGGELFAFACQGCVETDPSTCREGEVCTTGLLPPPLGSDQPTCSDGGGGFPFPFP